MTTEQDIKEEQIDDDESFSDAFDEFAGEEENPEGDTVLDEDSTEPAEPGEDSTDPADPAEPAEPAQEFDESQLPEPVRRELVKQRESARVWEHKYRSDAGRVSALQKQINELKEGQETTPTDKQLKEALSSDDGWQEFQEVFPEAAGVLETQFSNLTRDIEERLTPVQEQVKQTAIETGIQKQMRTLSAPREKGGSGHADFQAIAESQEFKDWGRQQHPSVQELFNSNEAADAAYVLDLYKAMQGGKQQQQQKRDDISRKRKKRQQRNIHLEGQAATPKAGPPDDFDGAFEYFAAKQ